MVNRNTLTLTAALACCVLSAPVAADTVFGVYAGGQVWRTDTSGSFGSERSNPEFSFGDESQGSYYLALEHPVPLFPNLKVRHNELKGSGEHTLSQDYEFFGSTFSTTQPLMYQSDFSHTDFTFYYELFDNDLLTFDVGATAKRVEGNIEVRNQDFFTTQATDGWIPTLYSQLRVGIPATPFTVYGIANAVSVDDSKVEDYEAGLEYRMVENLAVDVNLQLGYRVFNIELDDLDDVYSDLEYRGPYLGLEIHF